MNHAAFQRRRAGVPFTELPVRSLDVSRAKTAPAAKVERERVRIEQQHVHRVHAQLRDDLFEQRVEGDAQVETGTDHLVNCVQRSQMVQALRGLLEQARRMHGARGLFAEEGQQAHVRIGELARGGLGYHQNANQLAAV